MEFLKGLPGLAGLFKDGGARTSEFTALTGLYAAVLPLDIDPRLKAGLLTAGTVAYMATRAYLKAREV